MKIGQAVTAIFIRGVVFGFVVAALAPAVRHELALSTHLAALLRASAGFAVSVIVTVIVMLALSAAGSPPPTEVAAVGLRGTI